MIESRQGRRVVVTGLGVVAPCGIGVDAVWDGLAKPAEPAVLRRVADFDFQQSWLTRVEPRRLDRLDRFAQFAIAAAGEALSETGLLASAAESGPLDLDLDSVGVLIGSGIGGALFWEQQVLFASR